MISRQKTIAETLEFGEHFLLIHPCDYANPKLESEVLLAHALKQNKEFLISHSEDLINQKDISNYKHLLSLRKQKWPISQIVNKKEFYSRNFYVNKHVLTPRPETEHLIDIALNKLSQKPATTHPLRIIDIGTGSGCIAITIALEMTNKNLIVSSIDTSPKALKVAKYNWKQYKSLTTNKVRFYQKDIHTYKTNIRFDLIISNPPYIPLGHFNKVADDVLKREPKRALFAKNNGLEFYFSIEKFCNKTLDENNGIVILEIYPPTVKEVIKIFSDNYNHSLIKDYYGQNRILVLEKK